MNDFDSTPAETDQIWLDEPPAAPQPDGGVSNGEYSAAASTAIVKSTGPRTASGKAISKNNATKHGIFSSVVVLPGESSEEFETLLSALAAYHLPIGRTEELLVEKLASFSWRLRRALQAEAAEIQLGTEFIVWDQTTQQKLEAETMATVKDCEPEPGLIWEIGNPQILERCLEQLVELRRKVRSHGFRENLDREILCNVYGEQGHLRPTLHHTYMAVFQTSTRAEEERQRMGYLTPEQCKEMFLSALQAEIERLRAYQDEQAKVQSRRTGLEVQRRKIPHGVALDRSLRYEASLERGFQRTLDQLERLQRLRRGLPVAPRIDVNITEAT